MEAKLVSRFTSYFILSIKYKTSSRVFSVDKLNRTALWAVMGSIPISIKTWLGSLLLDEHAEPLAIPMPYLSSAVMRVAPSIEGKPKNDVFSIRGSACAKMTAPNSEIFDSNKSLRAPCLEES